MKAKGKHQSNRLTNRTINKLTEPKRYADGKGLYLLVDKAGNKRWMMRISIDGKRRDIGLGSWPLVSVSKVRIKASRIRLQVSEGIDPLAERRSARKEILTFQQAAVAVYESHRRSWKNAKHAAQWISTLERYAFPVCGVLPVDPIGTNHIMAVLNPIWLEKPETARRVRQRLSAVMDWAKAQGHRSDENPVTGITRALPKQSNTKTHHKALPYQELPPLISDIRQSGSSMTVRLALEFLILTATRTSEVLLAMWSEIDWSNKCWYRVRSTRLHSFAGYVP
ncbi:MAG: integrase arm-type DNA-binding domain-containing protein, partial [Pseudomonadota bacterium]